jgi:hypothetical protein
MSAIEILGLEQTYSVGFWRKRPKRALREQVFWAEMVPAFPSNRLTVVSP